MKYLKLLKENILLAPTKGEETIARADVLFSYIDSDFKNWNLDKKSQDTKKQKVAVFELVEDADFKTMFSELGELDKLCLTQGQAIEFVKSHENELRKEGYANFFLIKQGKDFFVASVYVFSVGRRRAGVYRFGHSLVWYGERRHQLVVPQLDSWKLEPSEPLDSLVLERLESLEKDMKRIKEIINL